MPGAFDAASPGELGYCRYFLRGWPCAGRCNGAHAPREERPPCPRWLAGRALGGCPFAPERCFFVHRLPLALRVRRAARCVLQVRATHAARVADFLRGSGGEDPLAAAVWALGGGGGGARLTGVEVARAHASSLKQDVALFVDIADDAGAGAGGGGGGGGSGSGEGARDGVGAGDGSGAAPFDVRAWLLALARVPFLATALVRCYLVDAVCEELDDAARFLADALLRECEAAPRESVGALIAGEGAGTDAGAALVARVHSFPHATEAPLADAIERLVDAAAAAADAPAADAPAADAPGADAPGGGPLALQPPPPPPPRRRRVALGKARATHLASCVFADGMCYASLERCADSPAARWGVPSEQRAASLAAGASAPAVCRAEFKLREVVARSGALQAARAAAARRGARAVALDVGAAPGGWTACLLLAAAAPAGGEKGAEEGGGGGAGFDHVVAVDPALLELPAPLLAAGRVSHLQVRGADAVRRLLRLQAQAAKVEEEEEGDAALAAAVFGAGGGAGGGGLSALVCDANLPTRLVLDCVLDALPLLLPGAALVVTLKNFDGAERLWLQLAAEAEARLGAVCAPGSLRRLHLFANGPREVTLVGNVAGGGGGC